MNGKVQIVSKVAPGSFGDRKVLIQGYMISNTKPLMVLLHGVHGCANLKEGNKYAALAQMLVQNSINVMIIETSRKTRNRERYGEDRSSWVKEAFEGKTYAMDLFDVASALSFINRNVRCASLWLWGFSLGGLHSLMITGSMHDKILKEANLENPLPIDLNVHGLILSGSGDEARPENKLNVNEPILDSLPEKRLLLHAAKNTKAGNVFAFYGSMDETFSKEACRRLFDLTPTKRSFVILSGVDHSFRTVKGTPSIAPLADMINYLKSYLFKHPGPSSNNSQKTQYLSSKHQ